jgi:hypothetical protein
MVTLLIFIPVALCFIFSSLALGLKQFDIHNLAEASAIFGYGMTFLLYLVSILALIIWYSIFFPLLGVRYAYTGKFRHFFDLKWLWRAFTIAPGEYLARTAAWGILLVVVTVLTPLTAGFAAVLAYALAPLSTINCAYLLGDYYRRYLDD